MTTATIPGGTTATALDLLRAVTGAVAPPAPPAMAIPSVPKLLAWGEDHQDPAVRDNAVRARQLLRDLQARRVTDTEIATLTTEIAEIERRRQELAERLAALQPTPAKPGKANKERDHDPKTVRRWAAENGIEAPRVGSVPRSVVDAWREATRA